MIKSTFQLFLFYLTTMIYPFLPHDAQAKGDGNAYDYRFETLTGEELPLSQYEGKVLLIVNTASECGFTPQYAQLQALYDEYKDKGLVIIGVPSNDFGGQEPGSNEEIHSFCKLNYGVTFPMTSKQPVTGENAHPFFKWVEKSLGFGAAPKWNFHKYLIDKKGHAVDFYLSTTAPDSEKIRRNIEILLNK